MMKIMEDGQSAYKATEEVEKLKKAMEKPGAIEFLYGKIIRSTSSA